jgi:hypothetical protein
MGYAPWGGFIGVLGVFLSAADFTVLFDGKTLQGWEGNAKVFRVQQAAIVGGRLDAPIPRNEFLCTQKDIRIRPLRGDAKTSPGRRSDAGP